MLQRMKSSAIHNLLVQKSDDEGEGIVIPEWILNTTDIRNQQEIIITKIGAGSWKNRIRTFAIAGKNEDGVTVRGSISKFLREGDLTCIIAETFNDETCMSKYFSNQFPIFDYGFDPNHNKANLYGNLDIQYHGTCIKNVSEDSKEFSEAVQSRKNTLRSYLSSLAMGLVINKTHCDCLQGSAEIPASVLQAVAIEKYQSVSVYNATKGGCADTYAVPMPEGVVMTTGAMASFAELGEKVNVASYTLSDDEIHANIIKTDGKKAITR